METDDIGLEAEVRRYPIIAKDTVPRHCFAHFAPQPTPLQAGATQLGPRGPTVSP